MSLRLARAAIASCFLLAMPLAAQRAELVLLGGSVRSPGVEFDRVTSTQLPPPLYTRQRGSREAGTALGAAATFAIRGHVFGEIGFLHHSVERSISTTGTGDPTGPFLVTSTTEGSVTSFWMGPSYRFVDRDRLAVSAMLAPALFVMLGDAYSKNTVFFNAPARRAEFGFLAGVRARYWLTERLGVQASVEDAFWALTLTPHPSEGPFSPENYSKTDPAHELRLLLGAALKLR